MVKWLIFFLFISVVFRLNGQTIPKDFKPQQTANPNTINKDISKRESQAFNNLNHPLSITGGALTLVGAALYIVGSETINDKEIVGAEHYSPQTNLQYIGIGVFAAGAVLFTIFSTERKVNVSKRKQRKKYEASDWEIVEE